MARTVRKHKCNLPSANVGIQRLKATLSELEVRPRLSAARVRKDAKLYADFKPRNNREERYLFFLKSLRDDYCRFLCMMSLGLSVMVATANPTLATFRQMIQDDTTLVTGKLIEGAQGLGVGINPDTETCETARASSGVPSVPQSMPVHNTANSPAPQSRIAESKLSWAPTYCTRNSTAFDAAFTSFEIFFSNNQDASTHAA